MKVFREIQEWAAVIAIWAVVLVLLGAIIINEFSGLWLFLISLKV
ncbi:hypothetical protein [Vibrio phage vB_VhaS-a]|nr:hypothetical protein [Vibrio phage vB_VhaS-a]